jgi:hypothetical protein
VIRRADHLEPDLRVKEVASILRINASQVCALIATGQLRAFDVSAKPGKGKPRWRITPAALQDFRESRTTKPPSPPTRRRRRAAGDEDFF